MKSARLAFSVVGASLLAGTFTIGCGGGGKSFPDATVPPDGGLDAGRSETSGDGARDTGTVPPTPGTNSKLIVAGVVEMIGSGPDTCTNQVPPSGDRWCGFARPSTDLQNSELWLVNVTKVAAGTPVHCATGVLDPNCIRLSTGLYSDPSSGFQIHGFDGDTLTYSEVPSKSNGGFLGTILSWRPGWTAPHALTGGTGMVCNGHPQTNVAICFENPVTDSTQSFVHTAELHAGVLDGKGTPLPLVDTVTILSEANGVKKWSARISPDGHSVAWSTRATDVGTEDLHWQNIGDNQSRITVAADVSQWTISSDSKKWFWLKSFNYGTTVAPAGILQSAPYPAGTTPVTISSGVSDFSEAGQGLLYRKGLVAVANNVPVGNLLLTPDRDMPAAVTQVDTGVGFVFDVSKDGKSALYTKNVDLSDPNVTFFDLYAATGGGMTMPCTLTTDTVAFLPPTFIGGGALAAWGLVNTKTSELEGFTTSMQGCSTKKFASDIYFGLIAAGDEGAIYIDEINPNANINEATLRYGKITQGALPSPGTVIQERSGLTFSTVLPALPAVLYTITSNTSADGLYLNAMLPFTVTTSVQPDADGGANDASDAQSSD